VWNSSFYFKLTSFFSGDVNLNKFIENLFFETLSTDAVDLVINHKSGVVRSSFNMCFIQISMVLYFQLLIIKLNQIVVKLFWCFNSFSLWFCLLSIVLTSIHNQWLRFMMIEHNLSLSRNSRTILLLRISFGKTVIDKIKRLIYYFKGRNSRIKLISRIARQINPSSLICWKELAIFSHGENDSRVIDHANIVVKALWTVVRIVKVEHALAQWGLLSFQFHLVSYHFLEVGLS